MSEPLYMQHRVRNEPRVPPLIKKSFAFVRTAEMRLAPEILVLEMMREIFFEPHYGNPLGSRNLDPDHDANCFTPEQRAVLHALRGRRKKSNRSHAQSFFAPAYPSLAKEGWLGKKRARIIFNFLLSGPIAQNLWGRGQDNQQGREAQQALAKSIHKALLGKKSCLRPPPEHTDILAATLGPGGFDTDTKIPIRNIEDKSAWVEMVMNTKDDELAKRITKDFLVICKKEGEIPRMQWLQLLMTFLRFALPMWLLAQMQVTIILHAWLLKAMDEQHTDFLQEEIERRLFARNRNLLHPTITATRELFEHVERYMKCRVEVSILLYCLEEVRPTQIEGKRLTSIGAKSNELTLKDLLLLAREATGDVRNLPRFKNVAKGTNIQTFLTREGEQFPAWRHPLKGGHQGKNIDEFFRVLYRAEGGDEEGGHLLTPEGRGATRGFRVFPGQMLLKMITFLADQDKRSSQLSGGAGILVLQDVEDIFSQYGIDFSATADAQPLLMKTLQEMGLLTGSPDSGSSVAVACPY